MRSAVALSLGLLAGCSLPVNGLGAAEDPGPEGGISPVLDASDVDSDPAGDTGGQPPDDAPAEVASPDGGTTPDASTMPEVGTLPETGTTPEAAPPADAPTTLAGDALQFSNGAYVNVGPVAIPGDFTVEAWVRPTSLSGETSIVAQDRNGQAAGQFRLGLVSSGQLFFIMSDGTGNTGGLFTGTGFGLESGPPLPLGAWTHVAVTKKGPALTLYVNGAQAAQLNTKGGPLTYGGPAVPLRIAARVASNGTGVDEAFTGTIDEVRFWSTARTAAQIAASMSQTVSPSDTTLLAYWRFDDGSGTTASDQETRYPGTLIGGPQWVTSTAF